MPEFFGIIKGCDSVDGAELNKGVAEIGELQPQFFDLFQIGFLGFYFLKAKNVRFMLQNQRFYFLDCTVEQGIVGKNGKSHDILYRKIPRRARDDGFRSYPPNLYNFYWLIIIG